MLGVEGGEDFGDRQDKPCSTNIPPRGLTMDLGSVTCDDIDTDDCRPGDRPFAQEPSNTADAATSSRR